MTETGSDYLLQFKNVSKAFGDCVANREVSFSVKKGSIHALVGENGAGKSTIVKILFGLYSPDTGSIYFKGRQTQIGSPMAAKQMGIGMIHQHFMLAGNISALDHLIIEETDSQKSSLFQKLNRKQKLKAYSELSDKFRMPVPWQKNIEDLSVGIQQRIEILKLLNNQAEVLILDEPTAVLAPQEIDKLFVQLKALRDQGKTILIVTHKLKEVFALADVVTVFRQGKTVGTKNISETNVQAVSELILGRKFVEEKITPAGKKDLLVHFRTADIDLRIYKGEILGIAGVEGNGQSELINALISPEDNFNRNKGEILWQGKPVQANDSQKMRQLGLRFLPEDRLSQGCLKYSNLKDNFILGQQRSSRFQKNGILNYQNIASTCLEQMKEYDVRPQNPDAIFSQLSGGNQQKLVVARELFQDPLLLIAAQPTRGVDIGASQKIHQEMIKERNRGVAVLLISSELDEVLKLSDRIVVMYQGKIVGEISNWSGLNDAQKENLIQEIGQLMVGGTSQVIQ